MDEQTASRPAPEPAGERTVRRRKKIQSVCILGIALLFAAAVTIWVGRPLLALSENPAQMRAWVEQRGFWGQAAFLGMMGLQVVLAVIPGEPFEIGAGYAFGALPGLLLCLIATAAGSAIVFGFTRLLGVRMVETFVSREKIASLRFLQSSKRLNLLIFLIFLIPGTPKDLITYCIGLTPMKLHTFLLLSTIGRIPSVISSTLGGAALGVHKFGAAGAILGATMVLSLAGILVYRRLCRKERLAEAEGESLQKTEPEPQLSPPASHGLE